MTRKSALLTALSLACAAAVVSSGTKIFNSLAEGKEEQHVHEYSNEWSFNENSHYYECVGEECEDKTQITPHHFELVVDSEPTYEEEGEQHYVCTTCGYETSKTAIPAKQKKISTAWSYDEYYHYHACYGDDEVALAIQEDKEAHTFTDVYESATATKNGRVYSQCSVCGYVPASSIKLIHAHTHVESEHITDENPTFENVGHWHTDCEICHHVINTGTIEKLVHNFSEDWVKNAGGHWHMCTDPGYETLTDTPVKHTFDSKTGKCSICGALPLGELDQTANAGTLSLSSDGTKPCYVINVKLNYPIESIDGSELTVTGDSGQGTLNFLEFKEGENGYTQLLFDMTPIAPNATTAGAYFATHLFYDGLPFDGVSGDIRNHFKDTNKDYNINYDYNSSPNHIVAPMYIDGDNHILEFGDQTYRIIYKWSMFMLISYWNKGTASPTISSTKGLNYFFNMYCKTSTSKGTWAYYGDTPVLYIYFTFSGNIRPDSISLDNGVKLIGFHTNGSTAYYSFDVSNLTKGNFYYFHLLRNGSVYNYCGYSGGDIKTSASIVGYSNGTKKSYNSKYSSVISASVSSGWYECYECYGMLCINVS